jgi:exodeoxyribonuclease VII small subunit
MKKLLTYNEAFGKLEKIVSQLEGDDIPLDKLTDKVKEANELIAYCEVKLRDVESKLTQQTD